MLKRYQNLVGGVLGLADASIIVLAWLLAYWLRFSWPIIPVTKGLPAFSAYAALTPFVALLWLTVFASMRVYQFSRAFGAETGHSPARAVEQLRVEAARVLLEQGRLQMDVIAREVGLVDRERMRRAFVRTLGQPPRAVRRAWRAGHSEQEDLADG